MCYSVNHVLSPSAAHCGSLFFYTFFKSFLMLFHKSFLFCFILQFIGSQLFLPFQKGALLPFSPRLLVSSKLCLEIPGGFARFDFMKICSLKLAPSNQYLRWVFFFQAVLDKISCLTVLLISLCLCLYMHIMLKK